MAERLARRMGTEGSCAERTRLHAGGDQASRRRIELRKRYFSTIASWCSRPA
jgi:hypothetical protein